MLKCFVAIDLGAESGRVIRALVDESSIRLEEVHRFPTRGLVMHGTRQWNITRIYEETLEGLARVARMDGPAPAGIGIDTWGVDFGFLAADGSLLGNPVHYRDHRTEGMIEAADRVVPQSEIYARTGIATMPFNTLYQLLALSRREAPVLRVASDLLFIGPMLGYFLTGRITCEYTIASTGQMLDASTGDWDRELLGRLGIPTDFLVEITPPGTVVGTITDTVARETGLDPETPYISTAVHDTACAVAAVPVASDDDAPWAYLSSGTWSLLGAELDRPMINEEARQAGYTNEGGVGGTFRFLKNIFGLWLVQECRRVWLGQGASAQECSYERLAREAEAAEPFRSVIALDDQRLFAPEDMPATIAQLCGECGQPAPRTHGEFVRCALESLALSYRHAVADMDRILGRTTQRLHIVGGGVKNRLLCQMTADACGIPVHAGPVEATAIGNVLVQGLAIGVFASLADGRELVRRSQDMTVYEPSGSDRWAELEQSVYGAVRGR